MLVRRAALLFACVLLDSAVRKNHWTFIANAHWNAQSTKNGGLFSPISKHAIDDMNENDFLFREKNEGH